MARSKLKSRPDHDVAHLHPLTNVPTKYQLPTPYSFEILPGQDFQTQGHYGKVKSRSDHDVAHLHLLTNVPTLVQGAGYTLRKSYINMPNWNLIPQAIFEILSGK